MGAIICPRNILIDSDWAQYFPGVFYLHFFKRALNPEYLNFSVEIKFEWTPWTFHLRINNLINGDVIQCSYRCIGQEKRSYSNIWIGKLMICSFLRRDFVLDYPRRDCFNLVSNRMIYMYKQKSITDFILF